MNGKKKITKKLTITWVEAFHKASKSPIISLRYILIDGFIFIPSQAKSSLKYFTQRNQDLNQLHPYYFGSKRTDRFSSILRKAYITEQHCGMNV